MVSVDRVRRACFAIVLLVSFGILFTPAGAVPSAPAGVDTAIHIVLFTALTYTGVLAGLSRPVAAMLLLTYAAASELIQSLPALNRSASPRDWLADAAGVGAGVALSLAFRRSSRWWASPP